MKKLLFVSLFVLLAAGLSAKPVDEETAASVAQAFMAEHSRAGLTLTDLAPRLGFSELYIYADTAKGGFVIVPKEDVVMPVLAYSLTSRFDPRRMPENASSYLAAFEGKIKALVDAGAETAPEWRRTAKAPAGVKTVPQLLSSEWTQGSPYNNLCPYDNYYSSRTDAGCVAISMAQIMRFWRHPAQGVGQHSYSSDYGTLSANFGTTTYDWNHMPDEVDYYSSQTEINAVATLVYHFGVAVDMDYSCNGSGAVSDDHGSMAVPTAENAIRTYFRYLNTAHAVYYNEYTNAEWLALLRNELDEGRPLEYAGTDRQGGHSFIFDGYDAQSRFHVNWGWGGYCDGYYAVGSLNPVAGGTGTNPTNTFNYDNSAIIGIRPDRSTASRSVINALPNNAAYGSVSGSGVYVPYVDTVTITATAATGCRLNEWQGGNHSNPIEFIANGDTTTYQANFEPVAGDTLYYCWDGGQYRIGLGSGRTLWGVRFAPASLSAGKCVSAIRFYATETGNYTIRVKQGTSSTKPATELGTATFTAPGDGWYTVPLSTPLHFNPQQSLWAIVETTGHQYPIALSGYRGSRDGAFYSVDDRTWYSAASDGYAFMVKAILESCEGDAVELVSSDNAAEVYTGEGSVVVAVAEAAEVAIYDAVGRCVFRDRQAEGEARYSLSKGVYIICVDGRSTKVVL